MRCNLTGLTVPEYKQQNRSVISYVKVPLLDSRHRNFYMPVASKNHFTQVIYNNQFYSDCSRMLVVEDDMHGAGLGYVSKMMALLLLMSIREGRVLIEAKPKNPRWCTQYSQNLQCFYHAWTSCRLPLKNDTQTYGKGKSHVNHLYMSLQKFHQSGLWYNTKHLWTHNITYPVIEFLFHPRDWVVDLSECVLRQCDFQNLSYYTVHVRDSPEKRAERGKLYEFKDYTRVIPNAVNVMWQTANPLMLRRLRHFSKINKLRYCYTDNRRTINDIWGGRDKRAIEEAAIVGVVNAVIGMRSERVISPKNSMWTWFISHGRKHVEPLFHGTPVNNYIHTS